LEGSAYQVHSSSQGVSFSAPESWILDTHIIIYINIYPGKL
jgi:hypothetical protein